MTTMAQSYGSFKTVHLLMHCRLWHSCGAKKITEFLAASMQGAFIIRGGGGSVPGTRVVPNSSGIQTQRTWGLPSEFNQS